jgi:ribosomal protein S18 acetylase RimI-like enzyme
MEIKIFKGKKIKIEKLSQKDLKLTKEFLNYINSLIEEGAQIVFNKKFSLKEEEKWIEEQIKNIKKKKQIALVAKDKNGVVGITDIKLKRGRQEHVGEFGISIRKEYRGMGLGEYLMKKVLSLAKKELKPKPKIIRLFVFSTNKIAQNLYKKMGFKIVAKIPKQIQYKGKLVDEIIMIKEI